MAVNKVIYGTTVLVDLTQDTVTADKLLQGYTAHDKSGALITGTASATGSVIQDQDGYLVLDDSGDSGGGTSWTLLATQEYSVNTTSTSNALVGNITLTLDDYADPQTVLWVHVRDKAGKRAGYFYGLDAMFFHFQLANGSTNSLSVKPIITLYGNTSGGYSGAAASSGYGVFPYRLYYTSSSHYVEIDSRYSSSYGTIDGTFKVEVYKLTMPSGMTLFDVEKEEES